MISRGQQYYDALFRNAILTPNSLGAQWREERIKKIAPLVVGETVLDVGCGLGLISSRVENRGYLGLDFSAVAIEWAKQNTTNPNATFQLVDIYSRLPDMAGKFDTVLVVEVLEHIAMPALLMELVKPLVRQRLIITVPRDMPGKAHIWPQWSESQINGLLGRFSTCELFGGENQDRWWIATKDYR